MINNMRINIKEEEARGLAEEYYVRICGLDLEKEKHRRMYQESRQVWEQGIQGISIDALVASFGPDAFRGGKVVAGDMELHCNAFAQIPDANVRGVYLYMITAGECRCGHDEPITRRLFADIWGTSYVDAGRDLLNERIRQWAEEDLRADPSGGRYLSNCFGPGFYGMDLVETRNLYRILNGDEIGVKVMDSGIMLPLKTCAGLYLVVEDPDKLPAAECQACIGNPSGCKFCKLSRKNRRKEH